MSHQGSTWLYLQWDCWIQVHTPVHSFLQGSKQPNLGSQAWKESALPTGASPRPTKIGFCTKSYLPKGHQELCSKHPRDWAWHVTPIKLRVDMRMHVNPFSTLTRPDHFHLCTPPKLWPPAQRQLLPRIQYFGPTHMPWSFLNTCLTPWIINSSGLHE